MHWPCVIRSQVLSGFGFFEFICVLICGVLMEMLGRGMVNPRVREWVLFLVLFCPALLPLALPALHPDEIQPQAFCRSDFPPRHTLLHEHHIQHLIVKNSSSHLGGCSSDEQREMQELGREGGVFALGANVLWCSSVWGLFFLLSRQWSTKWNIFTLDLIRLSLYAFWVFIVCKCIGSLNHCVMVINLVHCESSK